MVEFEKDRQIEKEIYAIITYFKLLKQAELVQKGEEAVFELIGGVDTLELLIDASKEGSFNCFQKNGDLLKKLADNLERVKELTFSRTMLLEKEILHGEIVQTFSSSINEDQTAVVTLFYLTNVLPASLVMSSVEQMMDNSTKKTSVQKKIGERK